MFLTDYDEKLHMEMERDEWTQVGLEQGIAQGQNIKLLKLIRKKLAKSVAPMEIAELLEEDLSLVDRICGLIREYPEWEDDRIGKELG